MPDPPGPDLSTDGNAESIPSYHLRRREELKKLGSSATSMMHRCVKQSERCFPAGGHRSTSR